MREGNGVPAFIRAVIGALLRAEATSGDPVLSRNSIDGAGSPARSLKRIPSETDARGSDLI